FAIALVFALASYSANDPSLNTAALGNNVSNLLGLAGALTSDLMLQTLGLASLPIVFLSAAWGWRLVSNHRVSAVWLRLSLL
ncbi:MAG: DNA translocase FtsK 4TM domain-containing protein, partial [Alphaproteobacteria bacterium]|nr:DNA translocase FtsK 4TM domain-containing protein [Alphaproteobacteria bacterium]